MLQAIERIQRYTKGKNFEDFIADDIDVLRSSQKYRNSRRSLKYAYRRISTSTPKDSLEIGEWYEKLYSSRIFSS